jgi:hypothetical protein
MLFLMPSCQKEFDPRGKYKDITIVYGLINPLETIHYIRIHRAFLAPGSVTIVAQDPDSVNFPIEDIDVRIYEITPDGNSSQLPVGTTIIYDKDTGYFYAKEQLLYYFKRDFDIRNLENTIKIEVEHKKTGKIVYAETPLVNYFDITIPRPGMSVNINPRPTPMRFQWNNAKNGKIYDIYYTMYYMEGRNIDPSNVWKKDSMVWRVGSHTARATGNGEEQIETFTFNSATFYEQVRETIAYDTSVWRRPYVQAKISIWCGSEDMYYYNVINGTPRPTPDIPEYTNLKTKLNSVELENEAFGIFTSRIESYLPIRLSDYMMMKYLPDKVLVDRQFIPVPVVVD